MAAQMQTIAATGAKGVVAPRRQRSQLRVSAVAEVERAVANANARVSGQGQGPRQEWQACRQPAVPPPVPLSGAFIIPLCLPVHPPWPPLHVQRGVPEGTPVVPVRDLPSRPRRNRKSETVRRAFSETYLDPGGSWAGAGAGAV